ncbi:tetratricopeptide repeat protein [Thalassobaculum sp.]|uniref:tetratricopeptide repeat protein n=1 Tax=Thalassobaculum sp. TaxID=2022740 RepID=UPI0032EC99D3
MADQATGPVEEAPRIVPALLVSIIMFAAEAALAAILVKGSLPVQVILAAHVVFVLLLVAWTWIAIVRDRDARLYAWLTWMTLVAGPLGPLSAIVLAVLTYWFGRSARPFDEWYASLFPDEDQDASDRLYERIVSGREEAVSDASSLSSLTDVLLTGTTSAKQSVVALLARRFRSDFAPALAMALSDPEPSVRVQAATAAVTIEERYHNKRVELEEATNANPKDAEGWLTLARHLDEYAYAGVLDADRQNQTMQEALAAYNRADRQGAGDPMVNRLTCGRLLLRLNELEEAEALLAGLVDTAPDPRVSMWHAECLFRLRRFDDLRKRLDDPRLAELSIDPKHVELGPVINLWQIAELLGGDLGLEMAPAP